jgi:hypothetical protein
MMTNTIMKTSTTSNCKDNLPDHIHIFSVEDHDYWKPKLLESVEKMKEINNIQLNSSGYYYDFDIPKAKRTYKNLMDNILLPYATEIEEIYGLKVEITSTYWFQQYKQGSDFGWHTHNNHFAMVYYVELPEPKETTDFLNYGQFKLKEGDIIFFPTFLVHRSPEIKSNLRKTIISSNIHFTVDRKLIKQHGTEYFKH